MILLASYNQGDIDELCDTVCDMDVDEVIRMRSCPARKRLHRTSNRYRY